MNFLGRSTQIHRLCRVLTAREPSLTLVSGPRGVGKSALVLRCLPPGRHVLLRVPPLPPGGQRAALADAVRRFAAGAQIEPPGEEDAGSWEGLFRWLGARAAPGGEPLILVLDDAARLTESRSRALTPLAGALGRARTEAGPLHVVLTAVHPEAAFTRVADEGRFHHLKLAPLTFPEVLPRLPGRTPADRVIAYGVFGGIPRNLRTLDPDLGLGANLRRWMLRPEAPGAELGVAVLRGDVQAEARYVAVLAALAPGEGGWKAIHAGVPGMAYGGQLAPYVKRLEELGLVEARRSLDARPASRSRRYRITDPALAFWYRFILPHRTELLRGRGRDILSHSIRPGLAAHTATVFPEVCRHFMRRGAEARLGAAARQAGSLWGSDYDIPVAGVLRTGAAYYGQALWREEPADIGVLDALDEQVRNTRYGFGKERRMRLVFSRAGYTQELARAAARRDDVTLIGVEEMDACDSA